MGERLTPIDSSVKCLTSLTTIRPTLAPKVAVFLGDLKRFKATLGKFPQNVTRFKATLGDLRRL